MLKLLKILAGSNYQPLNRILIKRSQLLSNYQTLATYHQGISIAPVLKSNAYGHGLLQIAEIIDKENPPFICVDSIYEAFLLKKAKTKSDIVIMGAIDESRLQKKHLPFQLTIINNDSLELFAKYQPNSQVHLFIDTGMNREGITLAMLPAILKKLKQTQLSLIGVMTHLAIANNPNHPLTKLQINNFQQAKKLILKAGFAPKWIHIGGSDALKWVDPNLVNLVRAGRDFYGVKENEIKDIKPILELSSTIVQIKDLKKGESIGYDATYTAQKPTKVAILPIGYNDGVDRRLSNKGVVTVAGVKCPIIGLISMNITTIDVSKVKNVKIGDLAIIFSQKSDDPNSIENAAKLIGDNPSNLLVGLHPSTRREVT